MVGVEIGVTLFESQPATCSEGEDVSRYLLYRNSQISAQGVMNKAFHCIICNEKILQMVSVSISGENANNISTFIINACTMGIIMSYFKYILLRKICKLKKHV